MCTTTEPTLHLARFCGPSKKQPFPSTLFPGLLWKQSDLASVPFFFFSLRRSGGNAKSKSLPYLSSVGGGVCNELQFFKQQPGEFRLAAFLMILHIREAESNKQWSEGKRKPSVSWHCGLWLKVRGRILDQPSPSVYQLINEPKKLKKSCRDQRKEPGPDFTHVLDVIA